MAHSSYKVTVRGGYCSLSAGKYDTATLQDRDALKYLIEGRNRQLRKMFEEIGHHVEKIRRIGYGALRLDVAPGEFRELTPGEVQALERAAKGKKVVPKKKIPEYAQLKAPVKKRAAPPRRTFASKSNPTPPSN